MTIHEMVHQVALLSSAKYKKTKTVSSIEIQLGNGRRQLIFGKEDVIAGERVGILYTSVGVLTDEMDARPFLAANLFLRHSRVALFGDAQVILLATVDLQQISAKACAPLLQELAAVADELERRFFNADTN